MMQLVRFISNQIAPIRHETRGGTQYLVSPAVIVKEAVLNGEYLPLKEVHKFPAAWNGRPFVIGHPKGEDGSDVSANDPERLRELQAGFLFNTEAVDSRLTTEIWVDVARAKLLAGGPEVLQRLEQSKPLELSTAYWRDREEKAGTFGDDEYEAIARNLRPDHLAALLDAEGACSWDDGCGAPRVNEEDGVGANVRGSARTPKYKGTSDAPWSAPSLLKYLNAYPGDKPKSPMVKNLPLAVKQWIASHTLLGDPNADNFRDLSFFPVVGTDGKLNAGAVRAVLQGRGAQAKIPPAAKASAQAKARGLLDEEFKKENKAMNENRVLAALQTFADALKDFFAGGKEMTHKQAILESGRLGLNEDQLDGLPEDVLQALAESLVDGEEEEDEEEEAREGAPESSPEFAPEASEEAAKPCDVAALEARIVALEAQVKAGEEEKHASLVADLATNSACAFTKERLAEMPVSDLEALVRSLSPADYSGQGGGPRASGGKFKPYKMPELFAAIQAD